MPFNETAVYMEKHSKHESSGGSTSSRESRLTSPTVQCMGKPIDNPLIKYQGCKWEQVFDFDKILKQIRNAERYYLRGKHDHIVQSGGSNKNANSSFPRREQPQVQRLNSNDMHFYGMVPKQPFDVVVCDKCLGIYTKMGFNNHMKLHHPQAWNSISSRASNLKDSGHNVTSVGSDNFQDNVREVTASTNLTTEQATATNTPSRHKSSKSGGGIAGGGSGSSGGSSRSRSKSKHHHHHHQQQQQQSQPRSSSASAVISTASSHSSQTSTSHAEVSTNSTSSKNSKKVALNSAESKINISSSVPKEIQQSDIPHIPPFSSSSSNSSVSLPPTPKAELGGSLFDTGYASTSPAVKEKPKASKRKSKNISSTLSLPPPENNESSNSSVEYTAAIAAAAAVSASTSSKSSAKRSKSKGGKDLKQLLEPQLSELDKAISSITGGQADVINETSNSNDNDGGRSMVNTPIANSTNAIGYGNDEASVSIQTQVPIASSTRPQKSLQHQAHYGAMQILSENSTNIHQQQLQQQHQQRTSNAEDNDNSILTLEDMLDSKFIHAILNTDESEIHFDESELDKATQQQQSQSQQTYMQPSVSKRMRYDEQMGNGVGNVENVVQQPTLSGKFAAFQQQQQQQPTQQAFHVANLEDIKMYTTAIDAQHYLANQQNQSQQQQQQQQQQEQHQITTIDPMQLQQLLYQQQHQQQQNLNAYTVGAGLDDVSAATLEQQRYNESDVIMCSAEQLHKEGKINAADYATLAAFSGNNTTFGNVTNNVCDVNAIAAAAQFQVFNIPSLTDDDIAEDTDVAGNKLNDVIIPQNHYVLPAESNDEEQLIYEITANNQVAVISQQRQQQMIAEFLTQAGYDSVDNVNVNVNVNLNSGTVMAEDSSAANTKNTISDVDVNSHELMDFDFSRLDTVKSCSSSSSSSADSKSAIKAERYKKFVSPSNISDDLFLNVFLYSGLPRPMAVNSFGLCKLPQGVASTFRKNLHATRKANNSPISLNSNGGASVTTRFSSNVTNAKSSASQNYFTSLSTGPNATGNVVNEFSIGSITITNQAQTPNCNSVASQQQQMAQKQALMVQAPVDYGTSHVNGLVTTPTTATSPPVSNMHNSVNARSARPKSAGNANSNSSNSQSKQKLGNSSSSNSNAATLTLPQSQAKTIIVNANHVATANADQTKFIKRSMISKMNLPARNNINFTAKQLSEIILHPNKDKYIQLLGVRDQDKDATTGGLSAEQQHRLKNVRQFYERRKRLLSTATSSSDGGYNQLRQLNSQQTNLQPTVNGLKQKFLRQRLLRTLSDCGINSKTNSNSANNSSNNDILRVS